MDLLLDTHILLWWLMDDPRLSGRARELVSDPVNMIFVSSVSAWEVAIQQSLGGLTIEASLGAAVQEEGFTQLPISFAHAEEILSLPPIYKDPFDRMLVAQARVEALQLLTSDQRLLQYPVHIISC
jgi:PIN domain nuclease of toxin-antitoxin system